MDTAVEQPCGCDVAPRCKITTNELVKRFGVSLAWHVLPRRYAVRVVNPMGPQVLENVVRDGREDEGIFVHAHRKLVALRSNQRPQANSKQSEQAEANQGQA